MTRQVGTVPSFPCKPTADITWQAACPHGVLSWWSCAQTPAGPSTQVHCRCEEKR